MQYEEQISVVPSVEMESSNFHRHLEGRHLPEGDWSGLSSLRRDAGFDKDRKVYEAWHLHCHKTWPKGYDHEHVSR